MADEPEADPKAVKRILEALSAQGKNGERVSGANTAPGNTPLEEILQTWFPVRLADGRISFVPQLPPGPRSDAAQRATEALMQGAALSELAKERGQREGATDNLDARSQYVIEKGKRLQARETEAQRNQRQQDYQRHRLRNPNFGVY